MRRVVAFSLLVLLWSCGLPGQTVVIIITPQPTYTFLPTYTIPPTYTFLPTYTPQPSYTPQATFTAEASSTPTALATVVLTDTDDPALAAAAMLAALNQIRVANGCEALNIEPRLQQAASGHVADIASVQEVSHVGSDGATLEERLRRVNYPFERRSEIIGVGTMQGVIDAWMSEPPDGLHRISVLNCLYTEAGVGYARDTRNFTFWVVDMANRKE